MTAAIAIRTIARINGRDIREATLQSAEAEIRILSWGAVLRDWRVPDGSQTGLPMTLGFDGFEDYPAHSPSFGALCGRVANRISGARFHCAGQDVRLTPNEGPNLLHSGAHGFGIRPWTREGGDNGVRLTLLCPDGEGGWPGSLAVTATFRLTGPRLSLEIEAIPDRETPINIAQHSYWNLDGGGDVLDHRLRLDADASATVDAAMIPTGALPPVAGGPLDFRTPRRTVDGMGRPLPIDLNMALRVGRDMGAPAAELIGASGRHLRLWTDQPGVQVYNAPKMALVVPGFGGRQYGAYAGMCLEAQGFPDAVNRPEFPSVMHAPDRPYRQSWAAEIV
ncbi:MAG: aldose 1-epimerase [Paracoccaceae bacterium]|jgi:aldose 1-epimerase